MDKNIIARLLNKTLLIGLTYLADKEELIEQKQYYGTIVRINEQEGIVIKLATSGQEFKLPPDFRSIQEAKPGEYKLRSTGEVILNPDYLTTWTITMPVKKQ